MRDYEGECWTQDEGAAKKYRLNHIPSAGSAGLAERGSGVIHQGSNSGYQAIGLAYGVFDADVILLLGYDMQRTGGKRHWFGDHPEPMNVDSPLADFVKRYATIKTDDVEIINCSRETALTCFPRMTIEDAIAKYDLR